MKKRNSLEADEMRNYNAGPASSWRMKHVVSQAGTGRWGGGTILQRILVNTVENFNEHTN